MKIRYLMVLFLAFVTASAFGASYSNNVDFGISQFSYDSGSGYVSLAMSSVTYRYIYYPKNYGFYYGFDGTVAYPTYRYVYKDGYWYGGTPNYTNAFFLMAPFGYRWPGKGKEAGFFLGAGPAFQFIFGYATETIIGMGFTSEFGYETNLTEGSQLHMNIQFGWSPWVFGASRGYITGNSFNGGLRFGISWRRIKQETE